MKHYVYILYSSSLNQYYRGSTNNLKRRLKEHNNSEEKATCNGVPWSLAWFTTKPNKGEAMKLERKLKNIGTQVKLRDFMTRHPSGPDDQQS